MRPGSVAVALAAASAACGEASVLVEVRSDDLTVPDQLDAFCLGVGDLDPAGGDFGRTYSFSGDLADLPQSLAVEAGGALTADAWARGLFRGQVVAQDRAETDFDGDVALTLARCPDFAAAAPAIVATAGAPSTARVALSLGRGGTWLVGVAGGDAAIFRARDGALRPIGVDEPSSDAAPRALVTFDADGDCDDDLLILAPGGPPTLWRRDGVRGFAPLEGGVPAGAEEARAAAAGDLDGDGDVDLAVVGAGGGRIWLNDGSGRFTLAPAALAMDDASDATAVAAGDLDGDGDLDLVVGRGQAEAAPPRVHANTDGTFQPVPTALPDLPLRTRSLALADVDGDGLVDLFLTAADQPARLYDNLGGLSFEDRSFVALPGEGTAADLVAAGDWDGDCLVDAVLAPAGGAAVFWRGAEGGTLVEDAGVDLAASQLLLGDVDDDGAPDLIVVGPDGVTWVQR